MNYVVLTGGLGNQMFIYAFKLTLSQKGKTILFHPYRNNSPQYGHAGFQLKQIFNIKGDGIWAEVSALCLSIYWHITRVFPQTIRQRLISIIGIKEIRVPNNFVFYDYIVHTEYKNTLFRGTWQSEKYFHSSAVDVRDAFSFNKELLNDKTKSFLNDIVKMGITISIHIRRSDYLSSKYISGFGNICTLDYYSKAIRYIDNLVSKPTYIVFSDDILWCKNNIDLRNAFFVDWNHGKESWQDMFLMSNCTHNIIANSSFSWWGAWLNSNNDKIVIAPKIWWNGIDDDVVPENWIRL